MFYQYACLIPLPERLRGVPWFLFFHVPVAGLCCMPLFLIGREGIYLEHALTRRQEQT
jgi:hypothetical protein